jgi:hypothetical protein
MCVGRLRAAIVSDWEGQDPRLSGDGFQRVRAG